MSKYGDVFKAAKDLLSKSYTFDKQVEVKSKTSCGVGFNATTTVGDKDADAKLKVSYSFDNIVIDSLSIGTDKVIGGELTLSNYVPHTKVAVKASTGPLNGKCCTGSNAKIGLTHSHDFGVITTDVDVANGPTVDATACFNFEGFLVGGAAKTGSLSNGFDLADYNALVGYKTNEFTIAAQTEKKLSQLKVGYHHNISSDFSAAGIVGIDLSKGAGSADVTIGGSYKLDKDATIFTKVNSTGKVGLSYQQSLCPNSKITLASEINASDLASDNHKFGFKLELSS